MYKLLIAEQDLSNEPTMILDKETGRVIPMSNGNRHYQEYLEWVAQGNEPEPADE